MIAVPSPSPGPTPLSAELATAVQPFVALSIIVAVGLILLAVALVCWSLSKIPAPVRRRSSFHPPLGPCLDCQAGKHEACRVCGCCYITGVSS